VQDFRQDALFAAQPVSKYCRALKAEGTQKHWPQPGKIMAEKFLLSKIIFKRFNNIRGCLTLTVAGYSATGLGFVGKGNKDQFLVPASGTYRKERGYTQG